VGKVISCYDLWLDDCANDNALIQVPTFDGMRFTGYKPVKPPMVKPVNGEAWYV